MTARGAPIDPRVAFGLCATAIALRAKVGVVTSIDQVTLMACLLDHVPEDRAARDQVRAFIRLVRHDPVRAGNDLRDFVIGWVPPQPVRLPARHDWQDRRDCGVE